MKVSEIISSTKDIQFVGDLDCEVLHPLSLSDIDGHKYFLTWSNEKNLEKLKSLKNGTVVVPKSVNRDNLDQTLNLIISPNPRRTFQEILIKFFYKKEFWGISKTSTISNNSKIGVQVSIGHNVVIESDCIVGANSSIGHNTVIMKGTVIGNNVTIGANCTIGGIGFGYEKDEDGQFQLIPHLGNVIIQDNVEIGNNTCIDRAVLGSTILKMNSKIDNLVHIAHGVVVGENSMIIANAMVAGSVKIGKNVWIAPSSSIKNGLIIGNDSLIGLSAVVLKNVEDQITVIGNPAKPLEKR